MRPLVQTATALVQRVVPFTVVQTSLFEVPISVPEDAPNQSIRHPCLENGEEAHDSLLAPSKDITRSQSEALQYFAREKPATGVEKTLYR